MFRHFVFALTAFVALLASYDLGRAVQHQLDSAGWQTVELDEPIDPAGAIIEHMQTPGNWISVETQDSVDCGRRFIIELGSGPIPGFEIQISPELGPELGPQPTPAPPREGIDPAQIGGAT